MSYVAFGASTADDCIGSGGWWDHASNSCKFCPKGQIHVQSVQGHGGGCAPDPCPAGQRTNRITYFCEPTGTGAGRGKPPTPPVDTADATTGPLMLALGGLLLAGWYFNKRPTPPSGASDWR